MRQVTAYRTKDGRLFDAAEAAMVHEVETSLRGMCAPWADRQTEVDNVVAWALDNAEELHRLLSVYLRGRAKDSAP